jgi:hypothetical protein
VIASLSGERRAGLASESGFCPGRAGIGQDEAELLCAGAADCSDFAARQARRAWDGATRCVSFHSEPEFLLPNQAFVPCWVHGTGYGLILMSAPLLNNPALVNWRWSTVAGGCKFSMLCMSMWVLTV